MRARYMNSESREICPCGRMGKPVMLWLCRCCYLEKEIRHAISELERGGDWPRAGMARLKKLAYGTASGTC